MARKLAVLPMFLVLLCLEFAVVSCRTQGPLEPGGTVAGVAAECGAPAARDLAKNLLDDVASALIVSGDWRQALKNVAARAGANGLEAVSCAAEHLLADAEKKLTARASMKPETAQRTEVLRDRAKEWLGDRPLQ
jgi:hypothetical protein